MLKDGGNKSGQTTIFIIVGLIIVAAAVIFFAVKNTTITSNDVPSSLQSPHSAFLSCLETETLTGIKLLESQGGYIDLPPFEPGSLYSPFSSQLNFAGINIPYWYYVSGNNIQKEQIPSASDMEEQLANFVSERIISCSLDSFREDGFDIETGNSKARTFIKEGKVEVELNMDLLLTKGEDSVSIESHKVVVDSDLKSLYDSAINIYEKEQDELFLEKYAQDFLWNYAPVDGVEIKCSPVFWNAEEVFDELQSGIEANTLAINVVNDKYFQFDEANVRFLNSKTWPSKIEVNPSEGPLMMAQPVGNQPGMGILGFCYVPYHFVYDVYYPVLVQVGDQEFFQFPLAVVIQGNKPREPLSVSSVGLEVIGLCENKNTLLDVSVYDKRRNSVEGSVSYECGGTKCYIGETENGKIKNYFPQCVGGRIIVRSEGYVDVKEQFSVVESGSVDVFMTKKHTLDLKLRLDGRPYSGNAFVTFISNETSVSVAYPEQRSIELSQGQYEVQVSIYDETQIELPASVREQCVEVPRGILGVFGFTKEQCFEVEIPDQIISNALSGGGKQNYYVLDSQLESGSAIEIDVESLPKPTSLEQLQANYLLYEERGLNIDVK